MSENCNLLPRLFFNPRWVQWQSCWSGGQDSEAKLPGAEGFDQFDVAAATAKFDSQVYLTDYISCY